MATIVSGGADAFSASLYGAPDPTLTNFLSTTVDAFSQSLMPAAQQYADMARQTFEAINNSNAVRIAKAVQRKAVNLLMDDVIQPLTNIGQVQQAPPIMQRFIMADPVVRDLYHKNQCDGYSDTYVDNAPTQIGESHHDYRRATDGLILEKPDGEFESVTYFDEVEPNEELDITEQCDVMVTWATVRAALTKRQDDPTSPFNAAL